MSLERLHPCRPVAEALDEAEALVRTDQREAIAHGVSAGSPMANFVFSLITLLDPDWVSAAVAEYDRRFPYEHGANCTWGCCPTPETCEHADDPFREPAR